MAIRLTEMGKAIVYTGPEWTKKRYVFRKQEQGKVPEHLAKYLFTKGGVPAECAEKTKHLTGISRIKEMNSCVSARLKKVV